MKSSNLNEISLELILKDVYMVLRREELNGVVGFQQRATVDHLINSIQQHFYKDYDEKI